MVVRQVGRYLRRVYHDGTNDYFIREGRIVEHIPTIYSQNDEHDNRLIIT